MSTRKPNDFKSELKPIWCPGCGDFGVLASLYRSMADLDLDPSQTVIVSGIGCAPASPDTATLDRFLAQVGETHAPSPS